MANIIAFEVQLAGTRHAITNVEDLRKILKLADDTAAKATFGSRQMTEATLTANRLRNELNKLKQDNKELLATQKLLQGGNIQLREAAARVLALKNQYQGLSDSEKATPLGTGLNKELAEAQLRLNAIKAQLTQANNAGRNLANPTQLRQTGKSIANIIPGQAQTGIIAPVFGGVGSIIAGAGPIGAIAALAAEASRRIIKLNAEVDDLLGILQKTGELTQEQAQALLGPLIALDTRTKLSDLLKIGEVLGKLGIEINANTIGSVDKLNVALSDEFGSAEEVTNTIGKLRQILNEFRGVEAGEAFLKIGNALNVLGASGAATAPVIASFASRIGGVSGPLGLTTAQILGTGAALEELGTASERGSSGFNRILAKMASAPETFAKVLGITDESIKSVNASATSFADLVNKDIFGAFTLVLQRLKELNLGATDFRATLGELKIKGQAESEVLGKLSQSYDLLRSRVDLANEALQNGNSINKEFEVRNSTLQAQLEKLGNTLSESFISSGFTDWLRDVVAGVNEWLGASNSVSDALIKEYLNLNANIQKAVQYNITAEERARIIGDLQEQYPEYFANLNQEKVSNEELTSILKQVNDTYAKRFGLLELQKGFTDAQEQQGKKAAKLAQGQAALYESVSLGIIEFERKTGQSFRRTGDFIQDAQVLLDKGINPRVSLFRDLSSDLIDVQTRQEKLTGATVNAAKEQAIFTRAVQLYADTELKATNAALTRVEKYKEEALAQKALILQLTKNGQGDKAAKELSQLQARAQEAARVASTREVNFIADIADAQIASVGKAAKQTAAEVVKIAADTEALVKGVGKPDLPNKDDKRVASRATSDASSERREAERSLIKFEKDLLDLQRQLENQRLDAISQSGEERRDIAIEKEQRRYDEQIAKVKEGEGELKKLEEETRKNLRESVIASQEEIKRLNEAGIKDSRLTVAKQRLQEAQNDELRSAQVFEDAKIRVATSSFAAQQALLIEHNIKIKLINQQFDNEEAKQRQKNQSDTFKSLLKFYDQLATESETNENELRKKLQIQRAALEKDAIENLSGKKLLLRLDQIDVKFDSSDLKAEKAAIRTRLEQLQNALSESLELDNISLSVNGSPAFNPDDLDKLRDQINVLQKDLTEIEAKEAKERVKNAEKEARDKIKAQQKYKDEFLGVVFDIAKEAIDATADIEKNATEREKKNALEALDKQFEGRLNAVKRNAIETERVEKELADKRLEIEQEAAEKQRQIAINQALINAALAITKAYASLDPISASIAALGIATITGLQIAKIKDAEFYDGGFTGPGNGKRDKKGRPLAGHVHAWEYVMPKKVLDTPEGQYLANRAEKIRKGFGMNTADYGFYADGGFTTPIINGGNSSTNVFVTLEMSEEQMNELATRLGLGVEAGAINGTIIGNQESLRRADREASLNKRLKI